MDWKKAVEVASRGAHDRYDHSVDALLDRLGLEHKRQTMDMLFPALGIFGAGLIIGAGLGVLFAPKRGEDLRGDIRHRMVDMRERGHDRYENMRVEGRRVLDEARASLPGRRHHDEHAPAPSPESQGV
jgi:hypothetical protein